MTVARLVLWNVADTTTTVEELRAERLPTTAGAQELWLFDETGERFGAFSLFPDADAAAAPLPDRLRELLGKGPDIFELFDVES